MLGTREIFNKHEGNLVHKMDHYFEIYDTHFAKYIDKEVVVLEIGVSQGGSIQLWKKFFGPGLRYYGLDINPKCKELEEEHVTIFIGSQEDKDLLTRIKNEIPDLDILIDDGGHTMEQQIISFEILYEKIKDGGTYLCEDNHTSYWSYFGGGMKRKGTYIEYVKNLIDVMHLWYAGKNTYIKNYPLKDKMYAIHIYDSIVVIDKRKITAPFEVKKGEFTVGYTDYIKKSLVHKAKSYVFEVKNRIRSMYYK